MKRVMRFRKKPVEVEAVHYTGEFPLDDGTVQAAGPVIGASDGAILIRTLEGTMRAEIGDWIIKGVKGEFYPCKPDIFDATYEPVSEGSE